MIRRRGPGTPSARPADTLLRVTVEPAPPRPEPRPWYRLEGDAVLDSLGASREGLTTDAAQRRREEHGPNELPEGARRTALGVVTAQLTDLMILVLLGAAGVSVALGELQDAVVILGIVLLNAVIGAVQELRAERAVQALRELAAPLARVRRDGRWTPVPAADVVPGDLLRVEAGDVVTADARLLAGTDLAVDEAALTGESHPVEKDPAAIDRPELPVGDRRGLVHRGTQVTRGHGEGVVVATGLRTELGKIAELLGRQQRALTPLQRRLGRFGKQVAVLVLGICVVVFVAGLARGEPAGLMLLTAVSLGVAAVPEALPAVVSVSLALGARRMIRRRALVRRLPAVETLGSITYACADKTGTLTEGRMRVDALAVGDERSDALPQPGTSGVEWDELGRAMALVNDAAEDGGDPTEVALRDAARESGWVRADLEREAPRVAEVPFDADLRRMSTVHRATPGAIVYVKGAPEAVLERCVPDEAAAPALARAEALAAEGLRVLAFARRTLDAVPERVDETTLERDLELLGLVALVDPPRPGAAESVALCRDAGITPVMVTGDHPATAAAIARRLGVLDEGDAVLTGVELERLSEEELAARIQETRVHARVSPEQKIRIVRALQARGEFVAMTGDGVNDAPALKRAEIGVAMGRGGTDVAREAADMVLLDDDFSTIVAAVREGRRVYDNVRKFVKYTMTSNAGEIWTLLLAPFLGLPLPLLPIQILWINLVTDGLPGLALGVEPEERGVMRRPPRRPAESLFAGGLLTHVVWCGLLIGFLSIGAQAWARAGGSEAWQSVVFTTLTLCQLAHVLAIRSERDSLLVQGLGSNRALLGTVLLTVGLQLAVLYVPVLQGLFHTQALSAAELGVCFTLPLVVFLAVELEKLLARRGRSATAPC